MSRLKAWRCGIFGFQPNNSTRQMEYPWAFYVTRLGRDLRVLEVGGGMSGFQFALARLGAQVVNVDPFSDYGHGPYDAEPRATHDKLNRYFQTDVTLYQQTLPQAGLPADSFDRVFCISTVEHLDHDERARTVKEMFRVLRQEGLLVLTVDLFLNLMPFTRRERNEFGRNISVRSLIAESGLELVYGKRAELLGFEEFDPDQVLSNLEQYFVGAYPALIQLMVLQKGRGDRAAVREGLFSDVIDRGPTSRLQRAIGRFEWYVRRLRE